MAVLTAIGVGAAEIQAPAAAQEDGSSAGPIEEITVSARRREEAAQDVPIPVSVVSGQLVGDAGAFNVNRLKELIPTVQFYSTNPRNSGDQHPRPGRAVRPDQRRPRAGRRALHRRRLLRAAGVGDARLPRRRSGRGAARTAGHAVRQEHDRRRDQRHDAQAELHAGTDVRAELRRPRIRAGEGVGHRPARREDRRAACRSPARSATARVYNVDARAVA